MKKISSIVLAGIITGLFAVNSMAVEMSAGIKGGLGIANFKGSGVDVTGVVPYSNKSLLGAAGGLALNVKFTDIIGAEVDVLYCMKGSKAEGENRVLYDDFMTLTRMVILTKATQKYNLNYLDIPVLVKFIVPLQTMVKPAFFMGPSFNMLLSSKMSQKIDSTYFDSTGTAEVKPHKVVDSTMDRKSSTKSLDIGLVVGASAEMAMGPGDIVVDVRYSFGLSDIYKKDSGLASLQNTNFAVMVGYNYKF